MKNKYILISIIIIAALLRLIFIGTNPPSLTWDEAAWGYNAYSLGLSGKDEFGRLLPYNYLESFGDFKPPLYAYLDIIPVKLLGLTVEAVRLPSAVFGILTVYLTYCLTSLIFSSSSRKEKYALLSACLLAVSPWHIMLSRAAFEANVATFFLVFGVYVFLRGIGEKPVFLLYSAISFALSFYTFNTSRIVAPLLVAALSILFYKKLWSVRKFSFIAAALGLAILLPLAGFLFSPQARLRYQEVNIFSNINLINTSNREIENDHGIWWSKILHNRRIFFSREYLKHYFDNLSFNFLFIKGDSNPKFSTQEVGQMYLWELPFFLLGLFLLFRYRENKWFIIPIWMILGIIPAATARETPHALRIETTLPTFQIIVGYALVNAALALKKYARYFTAFMSLTAFIFFIYFLHAYFVVYPWEFSGEWQYGYKDSLAYVRSVEKNYRKIYMTADLGRPYIYYLFYLKFSPEQFRKSAVVRRDVFGFVSVDSFSKYNFPIGHQPVYDINNTLYIVSSGEEIPAEAKVLKTFYNLDGYPALKAFTF